MILRTLQIRERSTSSPTDFLKDQSLATYLRTAPRMNRFDQVGTETFTYEELVQMKAVILNALHFRVIVATLLPFVERALKAIQTRITDPRVGCFVHYASQFEFKQK